MTARAEPIVVPILGLRVDYGEQSIMFSYGVEETVGEIADYAAKELSLPEAQWQLVDDHGKVHHRDELVKDLPSSTVELLELAGGV